MTQQQQDEEDFINHWLDSQPDLTEQQHAEKLADTLRCADLVHRLGITANVDFPED